MILSMGLGFPIKDILTGCFLKCTACFPEHTGRNNNKIIEIPKRENRVVRFQKV